MTEELHTMNTHLTKHVGEIVLPYMLGKTDFAVEKLQYSDESVAYCLTTKLWFEPKIIDELRDLCSRKFIKFKI